MRNGDFEGVNRQEHVDYHQFVMYWNCTSLGFTGRGRLAV